MSRPRNDTARASGLGYERKYWLPLARVPAILERLRLTCKADPDFPDAWVTSVYYDTPALDLLYEKIDSHYLKTRVRLRWYEQIPDGARSPVFAEAKFRTGSRRHKTRVETDIEPMALQRTPLHAPRLRAVADTLRLEGAAMPWVLAPVVVVRYRRRRFVDPATRVRIAVDTDLSAPQVNRMVLPRAMPRRLDVALLECKGAREPRPESLGLPGDLGCRRVSYSKYGSAVLGSLAMP